MNFLTKLFGSKYDKDIPYTYQAVIKMSEDDDSVQVSYMADKICTLTNFLKKQQITPSTVTIYEVFNGEETLIPTDCYMAEDGNWLPKNMLCNPMTSRYGDAKTEHNCQFRDRNDRVCGPC